MLEGLPVTPSLFGDGDQARYCSKCATMRRASQFPNGRKTCTVCKERGDRSYAKRAVVRRVKDVARLYHLTPGQLVEMRAVQGNRCAICGGEETHRRKDGSLVALSVDHNHETGAVRGLLCWRCNHLVGAIEPLPLALVARALAYLEDDEAK